MKVIYYNQGGRTRICPEVGPQFMLIIGVGADPVGGVVPELSDPGVLFDALDEVHYRFAPPMRPKNRQKNTGPVDPPLF